MPKLARSLNQVVTVACPSLFGDDAPRQLILVDIEDSGLWFSGEPLNETLSRNELTTTPDGALATIFLPFEQIAYVFDPRQFARPARMRAPFTASELQQHLRRRQSGRRNKRANAAQEN